MHVTPEYYCTNDGLRKEKVKESMLRISKVFQLLLPTSVSYFIKEAKKKLFLVSLCFHKAFLNSIIHFF